MSSQLDVVEHPPVNVTGPAWALGVSVLAICVFGLKALLNGIEDIAEHHVHPAVLVLLAIGGSLVLLGSVLLLCWQFSRLLKPSTRPIKAAPKKRAGALTEPRISQQLGARPESMASVTEHTTRIFEPVYRESMRKE